MLENAIPGYGVSEVPPSDYEGRGKLTQETRIGTPVEIVRLLVDGTKVLTSDASVGHVDIVLCERA